MRVCARDETVWFPKYIAEVNLSQQRCQSFTAGLVPTTLLMQEEIDVADAIGSFTVEKADCTVRADKQRLLGIIEASFGSTAEFNNACRNILMAKLSGSGAAAKTITPMKSKRRPSAAEELSRGESLTTMLGKRSAKVAPS